MEIRALAPTVTRFSKQTDQWLAASHTINTAVKHVLKKSRLARQTDRTRRSAHHETKTYVVFVGRKPGIYDKWSDAHAQVYRFPGSCYKGYNSREEAHGAFDQIRVEEPQVSEGTFSSSTSTATSGGRVKQSRNLATCLKAQSRFALFV